MSVVLAARSQFHELTPRFHSCQRSLSVQVNHLEEHLGLDQLLPGLVRLDDASQSCFAERIKHLVILLVALQMSVHHSVHGCQETQPPFG